MGDATLRGLGGQDRVLAYSFNAVSELQDRSGRGIGQFLAEVRLSDAHGPSYAACRWLVWAGLLHADPQYHQIGVPSLTVMQVGNWLGDWLQAGNGLGTLGTAIATALEHSGLLGPPRAEGNGQPGATGGSSTSGSKT